MSTFRLFIAILIVLVLAATIPVFTGHLETGFSEKTLWNWLELVGMPVMIAIITAVFAFARQREAKSAEDQRERDIDRAREATLRAYLDDMTKLILEHELQDSKKESAERAVAQAQTFMALRTLDGRRKGVLMQFLKESQLINKVNPIISLNLADLSRAEMSTADLSGADLGGVTLSGADLRNSNLSNSDLKETVLINTDLRNSDLRGAVLINANLHNSDLREAMVTREQLDSASDLSDALLPRGIETTSSAQTNSHA